MKINVHNSLPIAGRLWKTVREGAAEIVMKLLIRRSYTFHFYSVLYEVQNIRLTIKILALR